MAVSMDDDLLFTKAISGFRDAFMIQYAHLPESHRNQLWSQRLSQFLPTSTTGCESGHSAPEAGFLDHSCSLLDTGKRPRPDTPRTIPDYGLPPAKRRATVCDLGLLPS